MNILYVTNGFPPLHTAGTEVYTATLAAAFARAGHDISVICAGEQGRGPGPVNGVARSEHAGVTVFRIQLNWRRGPDPNRFLYDNPSAAAAVGRLLDEHRPDLVHITSCTTLSAAVIREIDRRSLPLVLTLTDFWFLCPRLTLLRGDGGLCDGRTTAWQCLECTTWNAKAYRWPSRFLPLPIVRSLLTTASRRPALSRRYGLRGIALDMADRKATLRSLLTRADVILAPSRHLRAVLQSNGVAADIRVSPYGHDLRWVERLRERRSGAADGRRALRVGFVGRFTPDKGVHVLLEAMRLLDRAPIELLLFGRPEQEPAYYRRLLGLAAADPRIRFRGPFARDALDRVYADIEVLAVPSLWYENDPLVIQEAFAAGMPVIASRLGSMADAVSHEVSGLLVDAGDPAALARAIRRLVGEPALLDRLRSGIPPVRTAEEEVSFLAPLYAELQSRRGG